MQRAMIPDPTWVFRITHVDNLRAILQRGGIYAPNATPADDIPHKAIHFDRIQQQRLNTPVPCGPGGVVHDYVPFYFAPRSPMLYTIHKGNVSGYDEGQGPIVYLVTDVQTVQSSGARFVFTDGHAIMTVSQFFDDLSDLDEVDWSVMKSRWWNDTPRSPDRKRRRQAEFMIQRFCPWSLIRGIGVMDQARKAMVEAILREFPELPTSVVRIKPAWYY